MGNDDRIAISVADAVKGLDELESKIARKGVRQALRAACKITQSAAKSTAPEATGQLKRAIKVRSSGRSGKKGVNRMTVGFGKQWFTGPLFYGAFVAFGHRVGDRKLGDARRQLAPNDWMTKAYDSTKEQAVEVFKAYIIDFIDRGGE